MAEPATNPSFYRRPLPTGQIAFSSSEGRRLFQEALAAGEMENWFALSEQFHTQAEPAFCGLGSLVVALNALEIDPGRVWKGPWRWFSETLLDCCKPLHVVEQTGVTLDELSCLASCNGAQARSFRAERSSLAELRAAVRESARSARGPFLLASYTRQALGQTGSGHFSPLAGYHSGRDLVLILDVARFKYPPHWVPLSTLWEAMTAIDSVTGRSRGWISLARGAPRPMPIYFRLLAQHGLGELVSTLLDRTPLLLSTVPTNSPAELVNAWVRQVDAQLVEQLSQVIEPRVELDAIEPERREQVTQLLAELHATQVFQLVQAARQHTRSTLPDELLAALLLALPTSALQALPLANLQALEQLREPSRIGPILTIDVAALREQLEALGKWQCDVSAGAPGAPKCHP